MRFDVVTIFQGMFDAYFDESIIKRAQKKKLITIKMHNLRKWAAGKHKKVDDKPYGGGPGMVFMVEPIYQALRTIVGRGLVPRHGGGRASTLRDRDTRVVLTSARGKQFTASDARRLSKYKRVVMICGRYEGVDERVFKYLVDEEFSVGPYILTGGELPAMVMIDAIARQVPGVLGKRESLEEVRGGSFPQYTRPEKFDKWRVPKVLLSGNHKEIQLWRSKHSK
ncbi:MAG: tRNA (guanine-N(1)-)-methyltransferase [Parcubacteria group bacterium GW2011_GWA2_47_26]|nr:MAG: tRNA (guanine-N(1)-)-methyltransferase [Parcubacteria group bacterium GW2011_GWA2_47_26]